MDDGLEELSIERAWQPVWQCRAARAVQDSEGYQRNRGPGQNASHRIGGRSVYTPTAFQMGRDSSRNRGALGSTGALLDVAWLVLAAVVLGLVLSHLSISASDFRAFYESALARRRGVIDLQTQLPFPDLNAPTLALLMTPLTFMSLKAAFWLWTALGACSVAAVIGRAAGPPARRRRVLWTLGSLGLLMPAIAVWVLGQVTWVLAYPLTRAWSSPSRMRAGVWMGVLIALKPPLALMGILLPWPVPLVAAATSVAITGGALLWTGLAPWLQWLRLSHRVDWIAGTLNGSLWGWAGRLQAVGVGPTRMSDLSMVSVVLVLSVAGVLARPVLRAQGDRRWILAFWWSLLVSPLGWIYYLPMALGPTLASWRWNRWTIGAFVLLLVPLPAVARSSSWNPLAALAVNSIYAIAVLALWLGYAGPRDESVPGRKRHAGVR